MTLTSAYSNDTIWALSFGMCATHVFLHDYTWVVPHRNTGYPYRCCPTLAVYRVGDDPSRFAGTISLNAAVFASILLASRLRRSSDVFAFILFAFLMFAGFPFLARSMRVIMAL